MKPATGLTGQRIGQLSAIIAALIAIVILRTAPVSANEPDLVTGFQQFDADNDGFLDQAIIFCSCITDSDRILVFDHAGDMSPSSDWAVGTDISNDTWIFDIGSNGRANLIIAFKTVGDRQVARLYDDVNSDGQVDYHQESGLVSVDESDAWRLEIAAEPSWYLDDGTVNLNVHAELDGPSPGSFEFLDAGIANEFMHRDGVADITLDVVDEDRDGVADYFLSRLTAEIPSRYGIGRSRLWVNAADKPSRPPISILSWPFLDIKTANNADERTTQWRFFDIFPVVKIEWNNASIRGFILSGYPIAEGYWLNNTSPIEKGVLNQPSYEAPHAWYDLARNNDEYPELNIRLFTEPSVDSAKSWQEVRYSWNQNNLGSLIWDYKLGMMGQNAFESVLSFPDFDLNMVLYDELPYWVTDQEWMLTTFVARETAKQESSEGIYYWTPWAGSNPVSPDNPSAEAHEAALNYLTGASESPPVSYFEEIEVGYRGEYNFAAPQASRLYLSAVDQRLHLVGAQSGLLSLGSGRSVTYADTNGDAYLDHWQEWEAGRLSKQLIVAGRHLIFTDGRQVMLKEIDMDPSVLETKPPRNHAEWQTLVETLPSPDAAVAPDDLAGMFAQIDGPEWSVTNAAINRYRPQQDGGFGFVLELDPGFKVNGVGGPKLDDIDPGFYALNFGESFELQSLTAPDLNLSVVPNTSTEYSGAIRKQLLMSVVNTGLQDVNGWTLAGEARLGDQITTFDRQRVDVFGGESAQLSLDWQPDHPGPWQIRFWIEDDQGVQHEEVNLRVDIPSSMAPASLERLGISMPAGAAFFLLAVAAAVLALAARITLTLNDVQIRS